MIQINFKIIRNGLNVCNVTYGNYDSFKDAAEQISKEATELSNASVGYFSQFNRKKVDGDYRFSWNCSWENVEEIVANNGLFIGDAWRCYSRDRDNSLNWEFVVSTSTSLQDVPKYLEME